MPRIVLTCLILSCAAAASADDWPQWRGPDRNGRSKETGLLGEWPKSGLKLAWHNEEVGLGSAGVSVADGRVFLQGHHPNYTRVGFCEEKTLALDEQTGDFVWIAHAPQGPWHHARGRGGKGGRGTPTVDGDVVYSLDPGGALTAFDAKTGRILWSRHLVEDLKAVRPPFLDYQESPLVDGDRVIVTPGGKDGTLAALNKENGDTVWRSEGLEDDAAYSSPIIAEIDGVRQIVQFTNIRLVGVDAESGKFLWYYTGSANNRANVATPIAVDGKVFSASDYGAGGALIEPKKEGKDWEVEELWYNRLLTSPHGGAVLVDGHFYGFGRNQLVCVELETGETAWTHPTRCSGTLTYAEGHLYCLTEKGELSLVEANPAEYVEKGRFTIPLTLQPTWAHPVVANGRLYVRNQNLLFAYDVSRDGRHTKDDSKKDHRRTDDRRRNDRKTDKPERRSADSIPSAPPAFPLPTAIVE